MGTHIEHITGNQYSVNGVKVEVINNSPPEGILEQKDQKNLKDFIEKRKSLKVKSSIYVKR